MASTSRCRAARLSVALRRVSDDEAEDAARQHDLPPVMRAVGLRNGGDDEREEGADGEAREQQRLLRSHACGDPADDGASQDRP